MTMTPDRASRTNLPELRAKTASATGPRYWRGLDELAETEEFQQLLQREFPEQASEFNDPVGRRRFLKLMGASLALAGLSGCTRQPEEKIVPFARSPERVIPGKPLYFASALSLGGYAQGVLVESHYGRPTKIEGNPEHPASLGATDVFAQASVLTLYDPDRSQVVTTIGEISRWTTFIGELHRRLEAQRLTGGAGLRILTGTVTSPTLASQLGRLLEAFPSAGWHCYEAVGRESAREGARLAFGEPAHVHYRFDRADVVLSLDADFLTQGPGNVRYARDFSMRRRLNGDHTALNRLYVIEGTPSNTGAAADHRFRLRAGQLEAAAVALARALGVEMGSVQQAELPEGFEAWAAAAAHDLQDHRGTSVVVAGDYQSPAVHALALVINDRLGNLGKTVIVTEPVETLDRAGSLAELTRDMAAGKVETLIIMGRNPVYDAPSDLDFEQHLSNVEFRTHLGLYADETSRLCHWHIPEAHELECWGDTRAFDGTVSIIQPLIAPLYDGKTPHELVAALLGEPEADAYDLVREYWRGRHTAGEGRGQDFERFWRRALHDGIVPGTQAATKTVSLRSDFTQAVSASLSADALAEGTYEVSFRPDPTIWDGRFANNGWLQETPKLLTKLTWDNAALVSASTAERLGVGNGDVVKWSVGGRDVRASIWITPGHAGDAVTLHLGYGRSHTGRVGQGTGFNAYRLRTSRHPWHVAGVAAVRTGHRVPLASTQEHHSMEGRHLVRAATLDVFHEDPAFAEHMGHKPPAGLSLYPEHKYEGYAWGMAIDLNTCIGCNACVAACTAENNVPVVGKQEVLRGREMHWIRVDRYYEGSLDEPETHHQPVMCQHCENAPCEVVCPVGATVHSSEGLNDMVYNRCVGTRYCSNNCPYKVRRFNFFHYADYDTPSLKMMRNPDVTVRSRGGMEKCTYCVQRINTARIDAEKEGRPIRDGEIVTACQGVCPAQAIVFGNINDPDSRVSKLKADSRNYGLLEETQTQPRTSYLAKVSNPHPDLGGGSHHG